MQGLFREWYFERNKAIKFVQSGSSFYCSDCPITIHFSFISSCLKHSSTASTCADIRSHLDRKCFLLSSISFASFWRDFRYDWPWVVFWIADTLGCLQWLLKDELSWSSPPICSTTSPKRDTMQILYACAASRNLTKQIGASVAFKLLSLLLDWSILAEPLACDARNNIFHRLTSHRRSPRHLFMLCSRQLTIRRKG